MNADQTCGTCRHGRRDPKNLQVVVCLRYPPIPYPIANGTQAQTLNARPALAHTDTCGEWAAKLNLVN